MGRIVVAERRDWKEERVQHGSTKEKSMNLEQATRKVERRQCGFLRLWARSGQRCVQQEEEGSVC